MVLGGVAGAIGGAIGALTGTGAAGKLGKLTITPLNQKLQPITALKPIQVQFNPTTLSITKPVTWGDQPPPSPPSELTAEKRQQFEAAQKREFNAPQITFSGGGSRTLTLELLFDVTEMTQVDGKDPDVRILTNKIVKLTRIQRGKGQTDPPPICELSWGKPPSGSDFPFLGVITNLTQNFTLFRSDGRPVRATLSVQFKEFLDPERDKKQTDPEFTTRVVVRGDTVSSIAAEVYRDPKQWRVIANVNRLDDPRQIKPGQRLNIPKSR
jgi:nucleoid-associated protein YgaU